MLPQDPLLSGWAIFVAMPTHVHVLVAVGASLFTAGLGMLMAAQKGERPGRWAVACALFAPAVLVIAFCIPRRR